MHMPRLVALQNAIGRPFFFHRFNVTLSIPPRWFSQFCRPWHKIKESRRGKKDRPKPERFSAVRVNLAVSVFVRAKRDLKMMALIDADRRGEGCGAEEAIYLTTSKISTGVVRCARSLIYV